MKGVNEMFGFINKKKAIAMVEEEVKFHKRLYNSYLDSVDNADTERDREIYQDIAGLHRAKYLEANYILMYLKKL
jgi:hypothetical protein